MILSKVIIGSELLLVLFLPLLSTIYTLKCDKKSVAMFVIATLLICLFFDFVSTFIYVIPSLMCGIVYGVLRKYKCKELELLCISGLTHMISISFSFLVITLLFKEINFMIIFEKLFSLNGEKLFIVTLLSLIVLGYCEAFLTHIIADNELEKLSLKVEQNEFVPRWFLFVDIISFLLFIILYFVENLYSVFAMTIFLVFFIPYIVYGFMHLKYKVLTFSLAIIFSFLSLFVIKYINPLNYLIIPFFILSPFVINNFEHNNEKTFKSTKNEIK